ncbi:hypothetical protein A8H38_22895 [Burkholderia thailandensis]|nr:hypothetical protein A8H38_22895 [Burkholderia thailandensis]
MNMMRTTVIVSTFLSPNQSMYIMQDSALMVFEWPAHTSTFAFVSMGILDTLKHNFSKPLHRPESDVIAK